MPPKRKSARQDDGPTGAKRPRHARGPGTSQPPRAPAVHAATTRVTRSQTLAAAAAAAAAPAAPTEAFALTQGSEKEEERQQGSGEDDQAREPENTANQPPPAPPPQQAASARPKAARKPPTPARALKKPPRQTEGGEDETLTETDKSSADNKKTKLPTDLDDPSSDDGEAVTTLAKAELILRGARKETYLAHLEVVSGELSSRLGYRLNFFLSTDSRVFEHVGDIHSWRIDKPKSNERIKPAFQKDYMEADFTPGINDLDIDGRVKENAVCMQAIYKLDGTLRKEFKGFEQRLWENKLMFVELVEIFDGFRQRGLAGRMLAMYHTLLRSPDLPEWYQFAGTIILVPSPPSVEDLAGWGRLDLDAVQEILVHMYRKSGDEV
ncbi:hypothetical protein BDY17DRAFT_321965 [Neohortaea acidophila]|uniref:Uncharacterized protein n=1 Tax=Neohortaea acidophila TaxID=245834 RepID=A0A6A6Q109_9PEZI|nr:uncharacterized protein BDY17DRAFT_321965 [Neohortaea acidophila]KAF2485097.1 hypothetical protein BDY17DRAFT_321965 [Neohortaea acidophila]